MTVEFKDELRIFREGLLRFADDALYIHQNNPVPDGTDADQFRETIMKSVMKMADLEGDAEKYEKVFDKICDDLKLSTDELPADGEMRKMWDQMEKEMKGVKGPNRKHYKDIVKKIRDEKNEEKEKEDEEEMEVMGVQHSRKDPISKKDIVNPVISEKCGHVYDRDSVTEFANKRKTIKCAMQGCSATIAISKLIDYPEYWQNIKQQS